MSKSCKIQTRPPTAQKHEPGSLGRNLPFTVIARGLLVFCDLRQLLLEGGFFRSSIRLDYLSLRVGFLGRISGDPGSATASLPLRQLPPEVMLPDSGTVGLLKLALAALALLRLLLLLQVAQITKKRVEVK